MSRRWALAGLITGFVMMPSVAEAHGIGGRADLPVPFSFFAVGAGIAVALSFALLAVLWPEPRLQDGPRPVALRTPWWPAVRRMLKVGGVVGLIAVVVTGLADGDFAGRNLGPVLVWIVFWLVIPFIAAFAGNWWHHINPWRTFGALLPDRDERHDLLARFGVWPAAGAFVAFTWIELVYPNSDIPSRLALAALVYTGVALGGQAWAGRETGLRMLEAFTTYFGLIGRISPIGADGDHLIRRGWLRALPITPQWRGLTFFVIAMIGTVTYDGLSGTEFWGDLVGALDRSTLFGTVALLSTILLLYGLYLFASWIAGLMARDESLGAKEIADSFAHTLVPIAFAYAFAHYFTLVIFEGQELIFRLTDPLDRGADYLGIADWKINLFVSPEVVWYLQVMAIVAGHVASVVLAHDRALAVFGSKVAVRTQYAMLGLMVALTMLGLFLLANG